MARYRKKPVIIEAFQLTEANRLDNSKWPRWAHEAWNKNRDEVGAVYPKFQGETRGALMINTLEDPHTAEINDWILRGVKGELYPCKPDIFEQSYEEVESNVIGKVG